MSILLAEDEFLIRDATQETLEDAGYQVVPVEHGREAIEHLDDHPGRFTCLVTDYHMPHAHGGEVVEHLRKTYPLTPAILASAYPHVTTAEWRRHHRVTLLVKPYDPDDLLAIVGRLVA